MIYIISALLCAFIFAALCMSASRGARSGIAVLGRAEIAVILIVTFCPIVNTIVAAVCIVSCAVLLYKMYKDAH